MPLSGKIKPCHETVSDRREKPGWRLSTAIDWDWQPTLRPRVEFNVGTDALELRVVTNPVIERFVLPEGQPGAAQSCVRIPRGDTLDGSGDAAQRNVRLEQHMNMIWHNDVGMQHVVSELRTAEDSAFYI